MECAQQLLPRPQPSPRQPSRLQLNRLQLNRQQLNRQLQTRLRRRAQPLQLPQL